MNYILAGMIIGILAGILKYISCDNSYKLGVKHGIEIERERARHE